MEQERYLRAMADLFDPPGRPPRPMGNRPLSGDAGAAHLDAIRVLLDRACPGWRGIKVVHVGGTSGKGSTLYMLAAMLSRSHRTGLLTSPHLFDVRERVRVDMEPIPREALVDIVEGAVVPECERLVREDPRSAPRFPEVMLAVAYCHFHREGAEWAVLEVAMGGRFDATNVVMPEAAATGISRWRGFTSWGTPRSPWQSRSTWCICRRTRARRRSPPR